MTDIIGSAQVDDAIVEECDIEHACHHKFRLISHRKISYLLGDINEERPDDIRGDNDEITEGCLNDVADTCHVLVIDLANRSGLVSIFSSYTIKVSESILFETIHASIAIIDFVLTEAVERASSGYCCINI